MHAGRQVRGVSLRHVVRIMPDIVTLAVVLPVEQGWGYPLAVVQEPPM